MNFNKIKENYIKNHKKDYSNILLIGFMGTGKSTVSNYLGELLEMEEAEMDTIISETEGISIKEIFEKHGEKYFRDCESNLLIELGKRKGLIVSCGGGIVLKDKNIENMKKIGAVVLLTAKPTTIYQRVKDNQERPVLNKNMSVDYISELMKARQERYEKAADIIISTEDKTIQEICEEIIIKLSYTDNLFI